MAFTALWNSGRRVPFKPNLLVNSSPFGLSPTAFDQAIVWYTRNVSRILGGSLFGVWLMPRNGILLRSRSVKVSVRRGSNSWSENDETMKRRFASLAFGMMCSAWCIAPTLAQETKSVESSEDPYLWLEDVTGDKALDWVRSKNKVSQEKLEADPGFSSLNADLLAILDSMHAFPWSVSMASTITIFGETRRTLAVFGEGRPWLSMKSKSRSGTLF